MKKTLMITGLVMMAVLIVIAALSLRGEPALAQEDPMEEAGGSDLKGEIHVTGFAKASVGPDTVILRLGVEAMSTSSVSQAYSGASAAMNAMINALAESGVDTTTDVQTTHFNISPEYEWTDEGRRRMVGYTATQGISVKVRDLDSVGMVIDSAIQAAGNEARFDGLNFVAEEDTDLRRELLQNAYQDALNQAERLAELAGLEIVGATSISTGFVGAPSITQLAEAALSQLDTAISPGQVDVSMSLQVTFATVGAEPSATPEAMGN